MHVYYYSIYNVLLLDVLAHLPSDVPFQQSVSIPSSSHKASVVELKAPILSKKQCEDASSSSNGGLISTSSIDALLARSGLALGMVFLFFRLLVGGTHLAFTCRGFINILNYIDVELVVS